MYYHECELCGATLDPGEKCDCTKDEEQQADEESSTIYFFRGKEKAPYKALTLCGTLSKS